MNRYYCYVVINGQTQYFGDYELAKANQAAQAEANRTGLPVKRQNTRDIGHSLFYPTPVPTVRQRKQEAR